MGTTVTAGQPQILCVGGPIKGDRQRRQTAEAPRVESGGDGDDGDPSRL